MTCIVAVRRKGSVIMGADANMSNGWARWQMRQPKLFRVRDLLVGVSGTVRVKNVIEHLLDPPAQPSRAADVERWLVREVVPKLQATLIDQKEAKNDAGRQHQDAHALIAAKGRIFAVAGDFSVTESANGYDSIGSGFLVALGSLATTEGVNERVRVKRALEAAEKHDSFVRRPFTIVEAFV